METLSIGEGTTQEYLAREFQTLDLRDERLNRRSLKIMQALEEKLTSCVRRLFTSACDMRQAYDFF